MLQIKLLTRADVVLAGFLVLAGSAFGQAPDAADARLAPLDHLRPAGADAASLVYGTAPGGGIRLTVTTGPRNGESDVPPEVHEVALEVTVEELADLVAEVRRLARVRPPASLGQIVRLGDEIGHHLLAPAAARLRDVTRFALVADGPLLDLPFAAIRAPRSLDPEGRYLIETRELCWVEPALHAVNREADASTSPAAERSVALAIADAVHRPPGRPLGASMSDGGISWRQHAARRNQANTVGVLGLPVISRFGPEASPALLISSVEENAVAVLHAAVEARILTERPDDSALLLSPARYDEQALLVTASEVGSAMALLAGATVVLSGLDTGEHGIGPGPFVRAFGAAGASTVVASLWPVVDESATHLFAVLYRRIALDTSPTEALRQAQIRLLRTPLRFEQGEGRDAVDFDASHPWFWAGYRVYRPSAEACTREAFLPSGSRASSER